MLLNLLLLLSGVVIVGIVVLVSLMGWGGKVHWLQRLTLCAIAAGLVWAGPGRMFNWAVGTGDLLFLAGIAGYFLITYGPLIWTRADHELGGRLPGGEERVR